MQGKGDKSYKSKPHSIFLTRMVRAQEGKAEKAVLWTIGKCNQKIKL